MINLWNSIKEYSGLIGLLYLFIFGIFVVWKKIYENRTAIRSKTYCKNCKILCWYPNCGFYVIPKGCETKKVPVPEGCPYILELTLLENKSCKHILI